MTFNLARSYRVDVSLDNGTTWKQILGVKDFNPTIDGQFQDTTTYDTNGWESSTPTLRSWKLAITVLRISTAGVEDSTHAALRAAGFAFGDAANVLVRWYRTDGVVEGYQGLASVKVTPSTTGVGDIAALSIELTGQGAPSSYTYVPPTVGTSTNPGTWTASTAYALNYYVTLTGSGAGVYKATTAGTSASTAPSTTGVSVGGTVTDGTVTWTRQS